MDKDSTRRRLTPLAVRAENSHIDIINGPGDHSSCIGYACFIRLSTFHTTVACGKSYDFYFSSTTPMSAKFHFAQAPEDCKGLVFKEVFRVLRERKFICKLLVIKFKIIKVISQPTHITFVRVNQ